jgi:hypothetical protein
MSLARQERDIFANGFFPAHVDVCCATAHLQLGLSIIESSCTCDKTKHTEYATFHAFSNLGASGCYLPEAF